MTNRRTMERNLSTKLIYKNGGQVGDLGAYAKITTRVTYSKDFEMLLDKEALWYPLC